MPFKCPALIALALVFVAATPAATEAITFKNRRELFVDDFLIREVSQLESRLGTPLRAGTALNLDQPWEGPEVPDVLSWRIRRQGKPRPDMLR
jgi:hypothetical protein